MGNDLNPQSKPIVSPQRTPTKLLTSAPVAASQIFTMLSYDPLTTRFPSRAKATHHTTELCPRSVHTCQRTITLDNFRHKA